jgi:transmembrane sensor
MIDDSGDKSGNESGNGRRAWRTDQAWNQLSERMSAAEQPPSMRRRRWSEVWIAGAVAALAAGIAIAAFAIERRPSTTPATPLMVATAAGERRTIVLPDSSVATLGPMTTLRVTISGRGRDVSIDGLASFRVVHDASRPFVVHAQNADVTDVGTEFVIRAYAADSVARISVRSGVVLLTGHEPSSGASDSLTLRAGDAAIVLGAAAPVRLARSPSTDETAWMSGTLSSDNATLATAARELSRWFDADVHADPSVAGRRVTAVYNNAHLAGVLGALAATTGIEITRHGRSVTLSAGKP